MDPKLKQRLVGATVLSALAVIFVPMLFEDSGNRSDTRDFEIPEIPSQVEQNRLEPAERLEEIEPPRASKPAEKTVQPTATEGQKRENSEEQNREHEKKPPLSAWVIQVGSFTQQENADQLQDRLRKAGYPAYVERGQNRGTPLYRVRVGPELDQERARSQRDTIARKFNIKGILLPVP